MLLETLIILFTAFLHPRTALAPPPHPQLKCNLHQGWGFNLLCLLVNPKLGEYCHA